MNAPTDTLLAARGARQAWDFPAGRQRLLDSFITGYLSARGQTGATVAMTAYGACVRYAPGMGRDAEHFVTESAASLRLVPARVGDWVTLMGPPPEVREVRGLPLRATASEFFMAAELGALREVLEEALAPEDAEPAMRTISPGVRAFWYPVHGEAVASLHCAKGRHQDVVIDRVRTDPAWRGRGLARGLMHAATCQVQMLGATRMLLIASPEGHRLYRRLGFETIVPVHVWVVEEAAAAALS